MEIVEFLREENWQIAGQIPISEQQCKLFSYGDLGISLSAKRYLDNKFGNGIYQHQKEAIQGYLDNKDVAMLTTPASGKSIPFYVAGIDLMDRYKNKATILAVYPLKALGREQVSRWEEALSLSGLKANVGRIDGGIHVGERIQILRSSNVIVMTPDIIHAWLLHSLAEPAVRNFLRRLKLVIVDEVHTYTGVFGSNAAFLFRRLEHVCNLLEGKFTYICASATIANPDQHMEKLTGRKFHIIPAESDTSSRFPLNIILARPPQIKDIFSPISKLLLFLAEKRREKFICFVDGRKQAEHIATITARAEDQLEEDHIEGKFALLRRYSILPYRAGYEEEDRDTIQNRLTEGSLAGVVSTSALELGIDISGLCVGVLVGVPQSSTSLHQRIGRVGRDRPGTVIVVNTGSLLDESIFASPCSILERPFQDSALYLGNERIQYIHAMCLARPGGEHDTIMESAGRTPEVEISSSVQWPEGFLSLCRAERLGRPPSDLQVLKEQGGETPNTVFPLRDVEAQYEIKLVSGPPERLGSISHSQIMREAYPGAVYYHITQPYRVVKVLPRSKEVHVRKERRYFTKPNYIPTSVYPNLNKEKVHRALKAGELLIIECDVQIVERISGFKERRGPNTFSIDYPTDGVSTGIFYDTRFFSRNYFSTGVIINHPSLDSQKLKSDQVLSAAELIYEAFVITIPLERQDLSYACDKHRETKGIVSEGSRFLAIYDQTYGSLRLSGELVNDGVMRNVLEQSLHLAEIGGTDDEAVVGILEAMINDARKPAVDLTSELKLDDADLSKEENHIRVIKPGSKGWSTIDDVNKEVFIERVFFSPRGLCYQVKYEGMNPENVHYIPVDKVVEVPGESEIGLFDLNTGEVKDQL
jgi:DEAD/DEAH box helicase domain-containing protein